MFVYFTANVIVMFIFFYIANYLLQPRFSAVKHKILFLTAVLFCTAYVIAYDFYVQDMFPSFAMTIRMFTLTVSYTTVILLLYKDSFCRITAFSTISLFLNVFSCVFTSFYITIQNKGEMSFAKYLALQANDNLASYAILLVSMAFLAVIMTRFFKRIPPEIPSRYWYLLSLLEFSILLITGILWDMQILIFPERFFNVYANVLLLGLLVVGVLCVALFSSITEFYTRKQQLLLLQTQNDALTHKLESERNSNESLRRFKHEINSLLTAVYALLETQQYGEIKKIVTEKIEILTGSEYEEYTENHIIDTLLNYKIAEIKKLGIPLEAQLAHLDIELPFKPADISSILLNLIDNAIDACIRMENVNERLIYIKICTYKQYFSMIVKNAYNGKIHIENEQIKTSKTDSYLHGCGLKNIALCVNKYKGIFDYFYTNNEFVAKVMLPTASPMPPDSINSFKYQF